MKRKISLCILIMCVCHLHAWTYDDSSSGATTTHSMQLRVGADFTKKWGNGLGLNIGEDLRFDMFGFTDGVNSGATFNKSYTSISLSYKHPRFKYLKADAGYTLKIVGNKDWSDVNKWMRHRVFFSVAGSYRYEQWSFSLRERFMTEIRMGEIDQLIEENITYYEHNRAEWYLRSKVEVAYHAMSKPLKPYVWVELVNTLNANELQRSYVNNDPGSGNGSQYIRRVRSAVGVVWKLNRQNSLDFHYRFNYGYDRDVNIKPNKGIIILTEEKSFQHAIGIAYNFGW